ncbi:galactan beta-1,4-galactosyltransferase GALS1-like [Iris pallida]|uniref:Glycosyltransferase family 92 protein n=1 Tax=Iris pallida TaxID=29817 RepID=A0AAX6DNF7_IRIPA|nr:galactan beta-1,4-galactosyltransferase GALS1-like [Iris pallida]
MRKDGVGGGPQQTPAHSPPMSFFSSWLDLKPFIATLVVVTLLMAIYQLQPYESLLSSSRSSSCPILPNNNTTAATTTVANPMKLPNNNNITTTTIANPMKLSTSINNTTTTSSKTLPQAAARAADPNKRTFTPYGSAAALFVQMGAYRGGPRTFAVVGLASKPTHVYGKPWFKCEYQPNSPGAPPVRAKAYKILPDWGYGRVYTVVVVNCTFPSNPNADNAGGRLLLYAYYSPNPRRFEKFLALEESPGSYSDSHFLPPFQYDYLYCGSSLYGSLSPHRIREWIAYHARLFGPRSHFVFHDAGGVGPDVRAVLDPWVRAGRATIQDIRDQDAYDGYYYNQFLVVNDCLHRYRHSANWTFYFDVDEYIFLPEGNSLRSVLAGLEKYTQFTIEQNPMSSKLCVDDGTKNYSSEWGFEKLVFRNSITGIRRDRKYAIQARNAYATGVHMSENVVGPTTHKTESVIRYYHYHNSINVAGEPCRVFVPRPDGPGNVTWFEKAPYVYDDSMKRVADDVKKFEEQTIGPFRL